MIIDTHAHVTGPMEMYDYFRGCTNVSYPGSSIKTFPISDDRLEEAIRGHLTEVTGVGTDLQIIGGRPWAVPTAERRVPLVMSITQQVNDMVARCVKLHPDRFIGLGVLPQCLGLKPVDCAEEMERCVKELGFIAFKINPDPGEGLVESPHMGDDYWYPIYEKMVELDTPALIHGGLNRFSREPEMGYFCQEESVAGWAILRSPNVFKEFPGLKIIIGHGGGYIPYQYGRGRAFRLAERAFGLDVGRRRGGDWSWEPFEDSLRRLYFDTVLFDQEAIELLIKVVGVDRCLFGSDKPAGGSVIDPRTGRSLNDVKPLIDAIPWLSDADRHAIYEENARKVYTRLKVPDGR